MKYKKNQDFKTEDGNNMPMRLNKYLSDAGVCSRREADRLIEAGKVMIDGQIAQMGMKVNPYQKVLVNRKPVKKEVGMILLAVNKPVGVVCTAEKKEKKNIINFMKYPHRIYPIGRLDKDSEGLLLMTNNGDIVNKIMRAGNYHEKEYIVTVNRPITDVFLKKMSEGVPILDTITRACKVESVGKYKFKIILTQGLNRQIRRMCEYFDYKVVALKRIRIMNIELGKLKVGAYREVTEQEKNRLYAMIQESANTISYDNKGWEQNEE